MHGCLGGRILPAVWPPCPSSQGRLGGLGSQPVAASHDSGLRTCHTEASCACLLWIWSQDRQLESQRRASHGSATEHLWKRAQLLHWVRFSLVEPVGVACGSGVGALCVVTDNNAGRKGRHRVTPGCARAGQGMWPRQGCWKAGAKSYDREGGELCVRGYAGLEAASAGILTCPCRRRVHVKDSRTGKGLGRCPRGQSKAEPSRDAVRPSLQFAWPPSPF